MEKKGFTLMMKPAFFLTVLSAAALFLGAGCCTTSDCAYDEGADCDGLEMDQAQAEFSRVALADEAPAGNMRLMAKSSAKAAAPAGGFSASASNGGGNVLSISKQEGRKVIYTVNLVMAVSDPAKSAEQIREKASGFGGYVSRMADSFIELRIPVDSFDAFYLSLDGIGLITSRSMNSNDVTDTMMDVQTRMDSMELLRKRLAEIAAKAQSVEDMLKVEKELNRVIQDLESLKGRMKYLVNQTDYSTVSISMTRQVEPPEPQREIPVKWLARYGVNLLNNQWVSSESAEPPYRVEFPENFLVTGCRGAFQTAVSPDGSVIRIARHANLKGGTLEFYRPLAERYFKEYQYFENIELSEVTIGERRQAIRMTAERTTGGRTLHYLWVMFEDSGEFMVSGEGSVYTFEFQSEDKESFKSMLPEMEKSLETVNLSMWR